MDERIVVSTDEVIDLTVPKDFEEFDNCFDVYLHNTDEMIGNVWFDEGLDPKMVRYYGNVGYQIFEKYRRQGYASRALKLIKNIMLDNDIKIMLFSISPSNVASRKTASKFGASVLCYRKLPSKHKLCSAGEDEIVIYRYIMEEDENEKSKRRRNI